MVFYLFDFSIWYVDIYIIYICVFKIECVLYFLCKLNWVCCGEKFKIKRNFMYCLKDGFEMKEILMLKINSF